MRNTLLVCVISIVLSSIVQGFLFDFDPHDYDCNEGDKAWKGCYDCKCNHHHWSCFLCGGKCADKDIDSHCPEPTKPPVTHSSHCNELVVFDAVARMQYVNNTSGHRCDDGSHHDYDALVMSLCKAPHSSKWIDGEHVWQNRKCSTNIKPFTPVFYHDGNTKVPSIMISCSESEIRVFYQNCENTPRVYHVKDLNGLSKIYALTWV